MNNTKEEQMFHFYTKTENLHGAGRVSIAGIVIDNTLQIGTAVTGKKEQFVRKRGKKIAEGRAIKHPIYTVNLKSDSVKEISKIFIEICKSINVDNRKHAFVDFKIENIII